MSRIEPVEPNPGSKQLRQDRSKPKTKALDRQALGT